MIQTMGSIILSLSVAHSAVFGVDDRIAVTPTSPGASLAAKTAVAILGANFELTSPGKLKLNTGSLGDLVCPRERFAKDPSLSYSCTGFLVAPDLIATAGHCMVNTGVSEHETDLYCQAYSWLFDYQIDRSGKVRLEDVPEEKLYRCKQVVYAIREETMPYRDFALVQLARPVTDREPVRLGAGALPKGLLSMVGYPLGAPAKLSRGAKILRNDPSRESFITSLDAFEGNSGSPVFNAANEVVGILIGGTPMDSLINGPGRSCQIANHCDEDGKHCLRDEGSASVDGFQATGSEVQRIAPLKALIETFNRNR